jgi:hypothetical protein
MLDLRACFGIVALLLSTLYCVLRAKKDGENEKKENFPLIYSLVEPAKCVCFGALLCLKICDENYDTNGKSL